MSLLDKFKRSKNTNTIPEEMQGGQIAQYNKFISPEPPAVDPANLSHDWEKEQEFYSKNMILGAETVRPIYDWHLVGNSNILAVGESGSGKTWNVIVPNVMQMNASYIIDDPTGKILRMTGNMLTEHGYKVRILNLCDMKHSNRYNPLAYIHTDSDVDKFVNALICSTATDPAYPGREAERFLYSACVFYMRDFCKDESQKTLAGLLSMIGDSYPDNGDITSKSEFDLQFESVPHDSQAWKHYNAFKLAADKDFLSIRISCIYRLAAFESALPAALTACDEMHLERLGEERTAIFITLPENDKTYNFLASILYTQAINVLYDMAEKQKIETGNERLRVPVRLMMDEFQNLPAMFGIADKLATMRHYNISATICIQSIGQLKKLYPEDVGKNDVPSNWHNDWRIIIGNSSDIIFLGSHDFETVCYFGKLLSRNGNNTYDAASMAEDECFILMQNMPVLKDKKYKVEKHPYYGKIGERDF